MRFSIIGKPQLLNFELFQITFKKPHKINPVSGWLHFFIR
ncbi:hypothetical protein ECL_01585 [Enterobacter cloacae subsp. cloacae ATCC 13047]|uniref:Uncharacterized protein n=1 Tax=Enterobacter cloacae subsp. cloacae (strain ATCC 13047 / DSM 30054 / NBRC 13535 / NCTC 10005 / WDCM 00083 / NCDC 279-56) TaxID=716541 RepID=A0A0H3CGY7_ENTCC|nr:hypothetical protein ECL_01585 [Enterobacter cloacae subsp. cloacae ATCC 13047]